MLEVARGIRTVRVGASMTLPLVIRPCGSRRCVLYLPLQIRLRFISVLRLALREMGFVWKEVWKKRLKYSRIFAIGLRRKWFIIIPFIAAVFISYGVYKYLPKVYKATTLILVQPQRVPEAYVRPTITETVSARLNTISQEILSRTRLEKVIQEFNLYPELSAKSPHGRSR